jgi:hypothetical protein
MYGEKRIACRVLIGDLWETDHFEHVDIDRMIKEVGLEAMDWIHLAQDRDKWWAVINIVMHPLIP